ncbi:MAG: GNAT family N-acetyltransferase [Rhodobacteraceae bacterium]|nr:GNAT family N-acetyltransferase [Paracoccaceae bacterium]
MLDLTTIEIDVESPRSDDARVLVEKSDAALAEHYTPDECFSATQEELLAPNVAFFVARMDGEPVGCVALVDQVYYGEVKRLFVDQAARGYGIASALMAALEQAARDVGLRTVRLETGDALAGAVAAYRNRGYQSRGAFGEYAENAVSRFFEKHL